MSLPRPYYDEDGIVIYHGDCREILPALPSIDLVLTDPPYGVNNNCDYRRFTGGTGGQIRKTHAAVHGDDEPFNPIPWLSFPKVILWGFPYFASSVSMGTTLIWLKRYDDGFGSFLSDAEIAWMKGGCGIYCRRDVSLQGESRLRVHPTQKPEGLMRWCIERAGDCTVILDPFMGSGTTLVAAKRLGRRAIGIEIEEKYCAIAVDRLRQRSLFEEPAAPAVDAECQVSLF